MTARGEDLVGKLRRLSEGYAVDPETSFYRHSKWYMAEAADEIESLRAELALCRDAPIQVQMHSQRADALKARNERLRGALQWYADANKPERHINVARETWFDNGMRAREALKEDGLAK